MKQIFLISICAALALLSCNSASQQQKENSETKKEMIASKEAAVQETKTVTQLEYLDNNRQKQITKLSRAHFPSTPATESGTDDPQWYGTNPATGVSGGPWEWLTYLGTDGGCWKTRIHAEHDGAKHTIKVWVTSKNCSDDGENGTFQIVDWNNVKWNVTIQSPISNDAVPGFILTKL